MLSVKLSLAMKCFMNKQRFKINYFKMSIENIENNIFIGHGFLESKLLEICHQNPVAIIADTAVLERAEAFSSFAKIFHLPSGEENKNRKMKKRLEDGLL